MALTQARMIAALAAGIDAKDKLATLREHCRQEAARSDIPAEQALANIIKAIELGLFTLAEDKLATLITEDAHFKRTRSRNDRYARRKASQRAEGANREPQSKYDQPDDAPQPPAPAPPDAVTLIALDMLNEPALPLPPNDPTLEDLAREIDEDRGVADELFGDTVANGTAPNVGRS